MGRTLKDIVIRLVKQNYPPKEIWADFLCLELLG